MIAKDFCTYSMKILHRKKNFVIMAMSWADHCDLASRERAETPRAPLGE
jgi:hypothetical protein